MDQGLVNDIISTSVGGAAGGAVAALVVLVVQGLNAALKTRRDAKRIYDWLLANSDTKKNHFARHELSQVITISLKTECGLFAVMIPESNCQPVRMMICGAFIFANERLR